VSEGQQTAPAAEFIPGRCYYEKRVGWRWEIWFCHSDESPDPANGATEWRASSARFWRWISAARLASEMWGSFNDGVYIANCRHYSALRAEKQFEKDNGL